MVHRIHLALAAFWVALLYPSLRWWHSAIWWVVFMSHYANIASEFSGAHAAKPLSDTDVDRIAKRIVELTDDRDPR